MDFVKSLKGALRFKNVHTENTVFKLHCRATVVLLGIFCLLLSSKQYFGDPIKCLLDKDSQYPKDYVETYCWLHGTYVVTSNLHDGDMLSGVGSADGHQKKYQSYYQWVPIVFCLQALFFYFPYFLWKHWEGGKMEYLIKDLDYPLISSNWTANKKFMMVEYLSNSDHLHNLYAFRYAICEFLNFANLVLQICLTNSLLRNEFTSYGLESMQTGQLNVMNAVFPKLAKCDWHSYGASGTVEDKDALCLLTLNILNDKLFLVLWFWLFVLSVVSFLALLYRASVIVFPSFRAYLLTAQARCVSRKKIAATVANLSYGDFFVLYNLGHNVSPMIYKELILAISDAVQTKFKKREDYAEV